VTRRTVSGQGLPGAVGSANLPQKRLPTSNSWGEGWVSPFGDTFYGGGASEGGVQRGKPRRGRSGTTPCYHGVGGQQ